MNVSWLARDDPRLDGHLSWLPALTALDYLQDRHTPFRFLALLDSRARSAPERCSERWTGVLLVTGEGDHLLDAGGPFRVAHGGGQQARDEHVIRSALASECQPAGLLP